MVKHVASDLQRDDAVLLEIPSPPQKKLVGSTASAILIFDENLDIMLSFGMIGGDLVELRQNRLSSYKYDQYCSIKHEAKYQPDVRGAAAAVVIKATRERKVEERIVLL